MVPPATEDDGFVELSAHSGGPAQAAVNLEAALALHPRGTAQILDFGVELLMKRLAAVVGICSLIWLPLRVLMPHLLELQQSMMVRNTSEDHEPTYILMFAFVMIVSALGQLLASLASVATVTLLIYGDLVGRALTMKEAVFGALRRLLSLFGVMLLTALASGGVLIFLMLLGILCPIFWPVAFAGYLYLLWRLAVAPSALVLEDMGVWQAIQRSWSLSKGSFWRWVGVSLLTFVLMLGLSSTLGAIDTLEVRRWLEGALGLPPVLMESVLVAVGCVLAGAATAVSAAAQTVYYLDLRMRREGFDLSMRLERLNSLA